HRALAKEGEVAGFQQTRRRAAGHEEAALARAEALGDDLRRVPVPWRRVDREDQVAAVARDLRVTEALLLRRIGLDEFGRRAAGRRYRHDGRWLADVDRRPRPAHAQRGSGVADRRWRAARDRHAPDPAGRIARAGLVARPERDRLAVGRED